MEYQCLIRECQIYKTYTIMLGIVVGCFAFFFRTDELQSLVISSVMLLIAALLIAWTINHYNAMYKAYPAIYDMKSSWLWYVAYVLLSGGVIYTAVLPQIQLTYKSIIIGTVFSFIFLHPMRGIKKYIRKNTRR